MLTFQDLIRSLERFWSERGCVIQQPYDLEVGAGTFNPATFLRALGPEPWNVAYVEPSRRPTDGRYGENPNRLQHYYQYQVILKPSPLDIQELYLDSLRSFGIDPLITISGLLKSDWESPTLGAWGLGWEVWLDGMEITQFTYFQQCGGIDLHPVCGELTYGIERICMSFQGVNCLRSQMNRRHNLRGYSSPFEVEGFVCDFDRANPDLLFKLFDMYEAESEAPLDEPGNLFYLQVQYSLKCSHVFNILDARGAISVAERTAYIHRVQNLARKAAHAYLAQRESMGFPILNKFSENRWVS